MIDRVRTRVLAGAPGNVPSVPWDTRGMREGRRRRGSVKVKWVWYYSGCVSLLIIFNKLWSFSENILSMFC